MRRTKSTRNGWLNVAPGRYEHSDSKIIIQREQRGTWTIIGGERDGESYGAFWVAAMAAAKTPAYFTT